MSNRSLFLLLITLVDMYLALCRNVFIIILLLLYYYIQNNERVDEEMIITMKDCVNLLFRKADKDECKIPLSIYELPHDVYIFYLIYFYCIQLSKVYTLMIGQSPLSYDYYKACTSLCDAIMTKQINKNCLFVFFECISLLSVSIYYNDDIYDIVYIILFLFYYYYQIHCRALALELLTSLYSQKNEDDPTKFHLNDVLPCYQPLTNIGVVQAMLENVFIRPEYIHSILLNYMDLLSSIWQHREHLLYDSSVLLKATNSLLTKYYYYYYYYIIVLIYQLIINY